MPGWPKAGRQQTALRQQTAHRQRVPEDVYGSWSPTCSPAGGRLAFVSDRSGEAQVWLAELGSSQVAPLATDLRRVLTVSWAPQGDWLACVTAASGASRQRVWVVRPDGSELRRVAGAGRVTALLGTGRWQGWAADGRMLVTERDGHSRALLIDPASGERQLMAAGRLLTLLDVSQDGRTALLRYGRRGQQWLGVVKPGTGSGTAGPRTAGPGTAGSGTAGPGVIGPGSTDKAVLSHDGSVLWARSDAGRQRAVLVAVSLDGHEGSLDLSGESPYMVLERDGAELEDLVLSPDENHLALVWNVNSGCSQLSMLELASAYERPIAALPRAVIDECCFSPDGSSIFLTGEDWSDPRGVWSIDLGTRQAKPVSSPGGTTIISSPGASTDSADTTQLSPPTLSHLASADGTPLTGWLYRPPGTPPWPTMVYLHGGPEAQERPVYNSLYQSLLSAGIAVFAPNVRGSSGFGPQFLNADNLAGRYGAIADVAACAKHLAVLGVADAGRIGCMGRSYGGYLTLSALVWYPELFSVGVDVCGMTDFGSFFALTEPWIAAAATSKYGDPVLDEQLLFDLSPIHHIDRLLAPLLVVHGGHDTNVPLDQAQQVVGALEALGLEHRYLVFPDEGHELMQTRNRAAFVRATVAWATEHLCQARQ